MSASKSKLKLPDEQFLAYANTIDEQCTENATPWSIDPVRLNTLNALTVSNFLILTFSHCLIRYYPD
jgi:hypothetical protein